MFRERNIPLITTPCVLDLLRRYQTEDPTRTEICFVNIMVYSAWPEMLKDITAAYWQ